MPARTASNWTAAERHVLRALSTPEKIQAFLDQTPYSTDKFYRSPRAVLRDRRAHCFDGALLAAAALQEQGERPLIVDLRAERDDDHVLTVFYRRGRVGAIAKSNTVLLRYREPVYLSVRELVMSFFDLYYNLQGEKALRSYSSPFDLDRAGQPGWRTCADQAPLEEIVQRLDAARHHPLLTPVMVKALTKVDQRLFDAGLAGADPAGLYGHE
jgi:hypothetical protein